MRKLALATASVAFLLTTTAAYAIDPGIKCQAGKLKEAGKYGSCRLKAESKGVLKGIAPDFTKCNLKFAGKWQKCEEKGGGECPTTGDEAAIQDEIADHTKRIADCLEGICPLEPCQLPATGQTNCWNGSGTPCTCGSNGCEGHDGDDRAGAALSYADNDDGTITDLNTGLMWEKKNDDAGMHDADNQYYWDETLSPSIWEWIADVNAEGESGFAGHNDWRIPNVKELQSIIDYELNAPAVDQIFSTNCTPGCSVCSCTPSVFYWSSTSRSPVRSEAWRVNFSNGSVTGGSKQSPQSVRAVRGGL